MSTVSSTIDVRTALNSWLQHVTMMTVADMVAIPEDQWTKSQGGCSKGANWLIADTVSNLKWTTALLKQETSSAYEEMANIATEFEGKARAIEGLKAASKAFSEALMAASDELLSSTVMAPWGHPMGVLMLAQISVNHIWYHDGQLNYIQCLLGDGDNHWMAE